MTYRLTLIEDDPAVAKGLVYGLKEEGFDVTHASTCRDGLDAIRESKPHLVLLDVRLPDGNGFDVCKSLRANGNVVPVIMVTARDEEVDKVLGLEIGADDYVVKPFSFRELVSRIRALVRRSYESRLSDNGNDTVNFGDISVNFRTLEVWQCGNRIFLTPTEYKLLRHLVENEDMPISRARLLSAVWGPHVYLEDERTVDVHIRHLREKIEPNPSKAVYIQTVRGFGYKFTHHVKKS